MCGFGFGCSVDGFVQSRPVALASFRRVRLSCFAFRKFRSESLWSTGEGLGPHE